MTRRRWQAAAFVLLTLAGGCSGSPNAPSGSEVEYRIVGTTTRASVTYRNATGGTTQTDVTLPWSHRWSGARTGDTLFVSALNRLDAGTIKAQIFKQGTLYRESESTRGFGIASVSGTY